MTLFHFCDFIFQFATKLKLLKSADFTYRGKPRCVGARDSEIGALCSSGLSRSDTNVQNERDSQMLTSQNVNIREDMIL